MQAIVTTGYGAESQLKYATVPVPQIGAGQLLIRVKAASVNPVDWKIRAGKLIFMTGIRPPRILGADFAGIVARVGSQVSDYAVGDAVWGKVNSFKGGAYAQFLCAKLDELAHKPESLDFATAAALPNVALTAYQALLHQARLQAGQRVLINGCSGGVGLAGLQIAKALGCQVTGVCGTRNLDLARQLGADQLIDYREQDVLAQAGGYDIFFDAVASLSLFKTRGLIKPGGCYVSTVPSLASALLGPLWKHDKARRIKTVMVKASHTDLEALATLAQDGRLSMPIERAYPLAKAAAAHRHSQGGHVVGKIILTMD